MREADHEHAFFGTITHEQTIGDEPSDQIAAARALLDLRLPRPPTHSRFAFTASNRDQLPKYQIKTLLRVFAGKLKAFFGAFAKGAPVRINQNTASSTRR